MLPSTIITGRLLLRPPTLADAEAIFRAYAQDPEVTRYLIWRPHSDVATTRAFLERCAAGRSQGTELTWVITGRDGVEVRGMLSLRPGSFQARIGYALARPWWGQGLMPEAAGAVVAAALSDPAVYRVWAVCDYENLASARVMEKIGMQRAGLLRRGRGGARGSCPRRLLALVERGGL
jgi:RimJ/RimL family protein N-acetyltransferase